MSWQEVLFRRLTGYLSAIPGDKRTMAAEKHLGWERHVYYYVNRVHPRFGQVIVCHGTPQELMMTAAAACAFDTGGMVAGHIVLAPNAEASPAELVGAHSHGADSYRSVMDPWVEEAFASPPMYVRDAVPSHVLVPEIDLDKCTDARAWGWEGRLLAIDYSEPPVPPTRVCFMRGQRVVYEDWLVETRPLSTDDTKLHIQALQDIAVETDTPVQDMLDFLSREVVSA